jgi:chemotaxis protein methyltransferase CheR
MTRALTEDLAAGVSSLVAARLGLAFPPNRTRELEQGLSEAARESGSRSVAAFAERLLAAPVGAAELRRLGRHLTIGETYFFRDAELFRALETQALPRLIRERAGTTRRLRLWSAGCSTGEEAYSLAILLARLLPVQDGWSVSIVGSDVNPAAVRVAEAGVYGEWSFRATPDWVRRRYFVAVGRNELQVAPWLRERVRFTVHNLAEDPYPAGGPGAVDLVLCRNVLMYFAPGQARRVVQLFGSVLAADGWLVPSPYEASPELFRGLERDRSVDVPMYRLPGRAERARTSPAERARTALADRAGPGAAARPTPPRPAAPDTEPPRSGTARRPPRRAAPAEARRLPAAPRRAASGARRPAAPERPVSGVPRTAPTADGAALLRLAKEEADRGSVDRAADLCAAAIASARGDPRARYLLATVELERGSPERAARALSEAIYLDPDFVLAHVALACLRSAQGRRADARRSYAAALALLHARPPHEEVEGSEGLTVLDLITLVDVAMSELDGRAPTARAAVGPAG